MSEEFEANLNRRLGNIERAQDLMINYMREIGVILGARDRLRHIDSELEEIQRERTNPPPAMGVDP